MKNYTKNILDWFFKTDIIENQYLEKLIKNRNIFDSKNNIYSLLPYSNQKIRKAILDLKFKNNKKNAEIFGEVLFDNFADIFQDWEIQDNFHNPILITTPVPFLRKIKRGYNQNDLIIESFLKSGGNNFIKFKKNILWKKHRKPQSKTKNKKERIKNQKDAYKILFPDKIKNKNIIIFDDIYTTGATIKEIKKMLKRAGVKKIKVIVLAH